MSTSAGAGFALVHGGFHGGWCWDALRPYLSAPSVAIDMPGRSGDPVEHAEIRYEDWIRAATEQSLTIETEGIILVGHSLAGISLPQVAIRIADRLRGIVFVASVVPPEGETFAAHYAASPIEPPTWQVPPREVAAGFLGTCMDEHAILTLLARLNAEPADPLITAVTRKGVPDVPALYIRAQGDVTGLGEREAVRLAIDLPRIRLVDAPGGHSLMMTRPKELAAILNGFLPATAPATQ